MLSVPPAQWPGLRYVLYPNESSSQEPAGDPIELPRARSFAGAACCQPTELLGYKATPLQARLSPQNTLGR